MEPAKTITEWMETRSVRLEELVEASGLDRRVVEAIVHNRYTPSPQQRQRLAAALGLVPEQIVWGHQTQVEHLYGHGPQFGRTP